LAQREGTASDEALMDAYARGDAAAFQVLYDRWRDRLFGYLARAFDPATAEELFQTLWMRIHGGRGGYDRARAVAPVSGMPVLPPQLQFPAPLERTA